MAESNVTTNAYWQDVRTLRLQLADQVDALDPADWDAPSWCAGWRVRDALGHLLHQAEATQASMAVDVLRNGVRPNVALTRCATAIGQQPVPELTNRLRAAANGRFHVAALPRTVVLAEVVAHGSDLLRPLAREMEVRPEQLTPALSLFTRLGRLVFGSRIPTQVRLVATDSGWTHGDPGSDEVHGRAIDLLLLAANRHQVLPLLSGPGLDHFRPGTANG
jgi:uncharacterized protein (TIGR03083 family)